MAQVSEVQALASVVMPPVEVFRTFVEDLHRMGFRGQGVTVGIVDSGVDLTDPKTKAAVLSGLNLSGAGAPADVQDHIGHGSIVARIILTIAPEAKLYPIRVFGTGPWCPDEVAGKGLEAAAAASVDLTNASLGGAALAPVNTGIRAHEAKRIPLVAAAGNEGDGTATTVTTSYPAADKYATSVASVDRGIFADAGYEDWAPLRPARYSDANDAVDVAAIGRIPHTWEEGTSFACPVVTGLLACYISFARATGRPSDDAACYAWLTQNTRQLAGLPARNNQTGFGAVNLRPYAPERRLEVDVDTLAGTLDGQPVDLSHVGLEDRSPGGLYGWFRPFLEAAGKHVDWDAQRRKAIFRL